MYLLAGRDGSERVFTHFVKLVLQLLHLVMQVEDFMPNLLILSQEGLNIAVFFLDV